MNEKIKRLRDWIEALRGGQYKQGRGRLRQDTCLRGERYCCLGVACDVYDRNLWTPVNSYRGLVYHLPDEVLNAYGLSRTETGVLVYMNDSHGASFAEIADWLEQNVVLRLEMEMAAEPALVE